MSEIFFRFKIARTTPYIKVTANKGENPLISFSMNALYTYLVNQKSSSIIAKLMSNSQVRAIFEKANIQEKELSLLDYEKNLLAKTAFDVARNRNGQFVTTMDLITAYLLDTEGQTKLLFNKKLKSEELYAILHWASKNFPDEEMPKQIAIHLYGSGIGEFLTTGWTPETEKYTREAISGEKPLLIGREGEFKSLTDTLLKPENNNVLLVGEQGVGKETLVQALAYYSIDNALSAKLNDKKILEFLVGPFIAGAKERGELEERLQAILAELSHSGQVIIYIPEFQNIIGASSYNLDISGALLPYLHDGNVLIIATMTNGNYKNYMEKNPLKEVFGIIELREPDTHTALQMVFEKASEIEKKTGVILSYRALVAAVEFANRYFQDTVLPGSAISLLEDVAASTAVSGSSQYGSSHRKIVLEEDVTRKIEEKMHVAISAPTGQEKDLLLHLEDKLHERVIDQVDAITAIAEAMRRVRSGMITSTRPISFLFLGPTGVGKTETAKALADLYYGGEKNMLRLDMSEYGDEEGVKRLLGAAPGEGRERGELTDKIADNPSSLVLLDEFEKAHPKILDLFLQVLEDGRLTDNKGRTVSFINTIIIATSNAGAEFIREEIEKGTPIDKNFQHRLFEYIQSKLIFKPELLNRFDDVVTFKPLGETEVTQIVKLMLNSISKALYEQDIDVVFTDKVIAKIAKEGSDKEFGARPLRRYIQDTIEDVLAKKKLAEEIKRGNRVSLTTDENNNLQVVIS